MRRFWPASTASVQRRSCSPVARPPAAATRAASEARRSTTIIRWPTTTRGRSPPASPTQLASARGDVCPTPLPPATTSPTIAVSATRTARPALRVRIERKILRIRDRLDVPRGRRDHRGVVGAEGERSKRRAGERGAQLRVRGDAADDRDPSRPDGLGGGQRPLHERADERALVARGE